MGASRPRSKIRVFVRKQPQSAIAAAGQPDAMELWQVAALDCNEGGDRACQSAPNS